jgi:hypothetical protein
MKPVPALFVLAMALLACSGAHHGRPGEVGVFEDAGDAGSGGRAGTGNAGTGAAPGSSGSSSNALSVGVQDIAAMKIEILTLQCAGDCADIVAVARGGNPPYTFAWEDGSSDPRRRVCLEASAKLSVSATDTSVAADEFSYEAKTATTEVTARVLSCDDGGVLMPCDEPPAEDAFDPIVKWNWEGTFGGMITPLVANLTDDNDDGRVDLSDTPDIVVVDGDTAFDCSLVVLDGATGDEHSRIDGAYWGGTPALGDVDGDRRTDIVYLRGAFAEWLVVARPDGTELWSQPLVHADPVPQALTIGIADLDADGSPEIILGANIFGATGDLLWSAAEQQTRAYRSPTAVDLDGDGQLEVTWGDFAYRHGGAPYYDNPEVRASAAGTTTDAAWHAIADLDLDGLPEIVVSTSSTLFVLDHEGQTLRSISLGAGNHAFPPAIADLDGDRRPEIVVGGGSAISTYNADLSVHWSEPVLDESGFAAATAFDFLGDASAEVLYGDEGTSWAFAGLDGRVLFMQPRSSRTLIEYPVVADVDNDGSADLLITSLGTPSLQVLSDRMNRWAPARRIMNQETYHVTNVNEDGTIPQHEAPHWQLNNSFRAQAQVNGDGGVCVPRP